MLELTIVDPKEARPLTNSSYGVCVREWKSVSQTVCAQAYVGSDWNWIVWCRVAAFRFRFDRPVVEALPEAGASADTIEDLYGRYVLPMVLQARGAEAIHASAVSSPEGVLAFCGDRGAGKSTVAFALSRRGYHHYADDVLAMDVTLDHRVDALSLPFAPRLRRESADYFRTDSGRRPVQTGPLLNPTRQPLAALFVFEGVRQQPRAPEIRHLSEGAALESVLQHAHCFNPRDAAGRRRQVRNYLEISAQVPVFSVRYSYGLDQLEELLDGVLQSAGVIMPAAFSAC